MPIIDRHRTLAFIRLSRLADRPETERAAHTSALETLLATAYAAATPAARKRFEERMTAVDRPWGAVRRPAATKGFAFGPAAPPVLHLLLGQVDDDPDSSEDGSRLPDRDSKAAKPWQALYSALDLWDVPVIERHLGASGWRLEVERPSPLDEALVEVAPAKVVVRPAAPTEGPKAEPQGDAPGSPEPPPAAAPPPPRPAGTPTPPDANLWRTRGLWIAGGLATGTAVLLGGRALLARKGQVTP